MPEPSGVNGTSFITFVDGERLKVSNICESYIKTGVCADVKYDAQQHIHPASSSNQALLPRMHAGADCQAEKQFPIRT